MEKRTGGMKEKIGQLQSENHTLRAQLAAQQAILDDVVKKLAAISK